MVMLYLWLIALGHGSIRLYRSCKYGKIAQHRAQIKHDVEQWQAQRDQEFEVLPADRKVRALKAQKFFAAIGTVLWGGAGFAVGKVPGGISMSAVAARNLKSTLREIDAEVKQAESASPHS
jgi:hypothetical protein